MYNSPRYCSGVFSDGVDDDDEEEVDEDGEDDDWADSGNADCGTDLRASARTSTVSRRSPANLVMAKSLVCSFSRAALRWRLRKSAWR